MVRVATLVVDGNGQDGRAGADGERGRSRRQRRALSEELDLDAAAADVAVADQRHQLVGVQRPQDSRAGARSERHDREPQLAPLRAEPLEELRRLDGLRDHGHAVATPHAKPRASEVPRSQVWSDDDHAATLRQRGVDAVEALV